MPFLQYKCKNCKKRFDELVKSHLDKVLCPDYGSETERDYSGEMYSATGKSSKNAREIVRRAAVAVNGKENANRKSNKKRGF